MSPHTLLRSIALLTLACACSQQAYPLDPETMGELDGALPDSDEIARAERDEPGHAFEGGGPSSPEIDELQADELPVSPELIAALRAAEPTTADGGAPDAQPVGEAR